MLIPFIRTLLLYIVVIFAIRLMGKRQVGEMQPTELVVTILVSAVASVPMQNLDIPLSYGIVPILTLILSEILVSYLSLKLPPFRKILTGKPVVVIENGKLNQHALAETRLSLDDLHENLRLKDVFDFRTVRRAQIETNGKLSIMLYEQNQTLTFAGLGLSISNTPLLYTIVADGTINQENMKVLGLDAAWLQQVMQRRGLQSKKQIYLLLADKEQNTIVIKKEHS